MPEALEMADTYYIMYSPKNEKPEHKQQPEKIQRRRKRAALTADMTQRIQQYLNESKSIRQTAKLEGIDESSIRYAIRRGKIKNDKNQK